MAFPSPLRVLPFRVLSESASQRPPGPARMAWANPGPRSARPGPVRPGRAIRRLLRPWAQQPSARRPRAHGGLNGDRDSAGRPGPVPPRVLVSLAACPPGPGLAPGPRRPTPCASGPPGPARARCAAGALPPRGARGSSLPRGVEAGRIGRRRQTGRRAARRPTGRGKRAWPGPARRRPGPVRPEISARLRARSAGPAGPGRRGGHGRLPRSVTAGAGRPAIGRRASPRLGTRECLGPAPAAAHACRVRWKEPAGRRPVSAGRPGPGRQAPPSGRATSRLWDSDGARDVVLGLGPEWRLRSPVSDPVAPLAGL